MRFESVKELKGEAFRRLTGVHRSTFEAMERCFLAPNASRRQLAANLTCLALKTSF